MNAALKQTVIVERDGTIRISSGLSPGAKAEVIVFDATESARPDRSEDFFDGQTLDELATQQNITTPLPFKKLLGGWPKAERGDGFDQALARWRSARNGRSRR